MKKIPPSTTFGMLSRFEALVEVLNRMKVLTSLASSGHIKGPTIQNNLYDLLVKHNYGGIWIKECRVKPILGKQYNDKIDILGTFERYKVIIEIDTSRADQVGKKIASRMAVYCDEPILYIAICYPGTKRMNTNECIKYFNYGIRILRQFSNGSEFLGIIIEEQAPQCLNIKPVYLCFQKNCNN